MARILAIDYGTKRIGLAATDPLQITSTALATVPSQDIFVWLEKYLAQEPVERILVGEPKHADGNPTQIAHLVVGFVRKLEKLYPGIPVQMVDESYSSVEAGRIIREVVTKKSKRQDKGLMDRVAAMVILEDFLNSLR